MDTWPEKRISCILPLLPSMFYFVTATESSEQRMLQLFWNWALIRHNQVAMQSFGKASFFSTLVKGCLLAGTGSEFLLVKGGATKLRIGLSSPSFHGKAIHMVIFLFSGTKMCDLKYI